MMRELSGETLQKRYDMRDIDNDQYIMHHSMFNDSVFESDTNYELYDQKYTETLKEKLEAADDDALNYRLNELREEAATNQLQKFGAFCGTIVSLFIAIIILGSTNNTLGTNALSYAFIVPFGTVFGVVAAKICLNTKMKTFAKRKAKIINTQYYGEYMDLKQELLRRENAYDSEQENQ